jgi:hypothetical protein
MAASCVLSPISERKMMLKVVSKMRQFIRQPGGDHRPDALFIVDRMRAHHLQLAAIEAAVAKDRRQERLQIVARAYVQVIRDILLPTGKQAAVIISSISSYRAIENELNFVFFAQPDW